MIKYLLYALSLSPLTATSQTAYPTGVEAVLKEAAGNRSELEKAIVHYKKTGDDLKLKALYFLIENMDIHYSQSYYWADENNKRIRFNESTYPDYASAKAALDNLLKKNPKIHAVPFIYKDIDSIKAGFLIDNIDRAFSAWHSEGKNNVSFQNFCEYILPYRISVEPLEDWRQRYCKQFAFVAKEKKLEDAITSCASDFRTWFKDTYKIEKRKEPLPRLGGLQLLNRKSGACEDIVDMEVFTLRSQGIPVSVDAVPYWGTSSGTHFLNVAFNDKMKATSFDVTTPAIFVDKLVREPAKVVRLTYSKQQNTLASKEKLDNIPDGYLRTSNYVDVTKEYWQTKDVHSKIFADARASKISYACVFNTLEWKPAWWGTISGDSVVFTNMCKGSVFLPMVYVHKKLIPAGYPVASGYNNTLTLQPDTIHTHAIHITEEAAYVIFRPNKKYKLFYWDNKWKLIGQQTTVNNTKELVFNKVPRNALLIILPEYTQHKERPFMVTDDGKHIWW